MEEEEEEEIEKNVLGNSHMALLLLGIFGSGSKKLQGFLELGSRRGGS
jgi:hypothetical protein